MPYQYQISISLLYSSAYYKVVQDSANSVAVAISYSMIDADADDKVPLSAQLKINPIPFKN